MVNREHMQQWIDALRSGEYTQITGWLEIGYGEGQCAEGVACREALKAGVKMDVDRKIVGITSPPRREVATQFDSHDQALPPAVRDWLGLNENRAWIDTDLGLVDVADANDHGMSFADIADGLYERYLKEPSDD